MRPHAYPDTRVTGYGYPPGYPGTVQSVFNPDFVQTIWGRYSGKFEIDVNLNFGPPGPGDWVTVTPLGLGGPQG
eukprot:3507139-Rhodomonas_salina.1